MEAHDSWKLDLTCWWSYACEAEMWAAGCDVTLRQLVSVGLLNVLYNNTSACELLCFDSLRVLLTHYLMPLFWWDNINRTFSREHSLKEPLHVQPKVARINQHVLFSQWVIFMHVIKGFLKKPLFLFLWEFKMYYVLDYLFKMLLILLFTGSCVLGMKPNLTKNSTL